MKKLPAMVILGTLGLAACGETDSTSSENSNSGRVAADANGSMGAAPAEAPGQTGEAYSGNGDITEISANKVTISHGPIEGIGWPAMTVGFSVNSPDLLRGLSVGDPVKFNFQKAGSDYVITSIEKT